MQFETGDRKIRSSKQQQGDHAQHQCGADEVRVDPTILRPEIKIAVPLVNQLGSEDGGGKKSQVQIGRFSHNDEDNHAEGAQKQKGPKSSTDKERVSD